MLWTKEGMTVKIYLQFDRPRILFSFWMNSLIAHEYLSSIFIVSIIITKTLHPSDSRPTPFLALVIVFHTQWEMVEYASKQRALYKNRKSMQSYIFFWTGKVGALSFSVSVFTLLSDGFLLPPAAKSINPVNLFCVPVCHWIRVQRYKKWRELCKNFLQKSLCDVIIVCPVR